MLIKPNEQHRARKANLDAAHLCGVYVGGNSDVTSGAVIRTQDMTRHLRRTTRIGPHCAPGPHRHCFLFGSDGWADEGGSDTS